MKKYLRVTMPDGSKWDVPAELIARHRAEVLVKDDPSADIEGEINFCMNDSYELKDWAANNMNWDDVKDHAERVAEPTVVDFQEGWVNGPKEVVEKGSLWSNNQ